MSLAGKMSFMSMSPQLVSALLLGEGEKNSGLHSFCGFKYLIVLHQPKLGI